MARPVRIHVPNATYLVQLRARAEQVLFTSEEDRELFLRCMKDAANKLSVKIYAFALMENSVLIFLRNGSVPLSKFVHYTQAGYFNRLRVIHGEAKPLLHDRHRAILVEESTCFMEVMQRVHLAPIIGGHWSNQSEGRKWGEVSTNRWTSFAAILGKLDLGDIIERDELIDAFSKLDSKRPLDAFYHFIIQGTKDLENDILDRVVAMSLLGSRHFVNKYRHQAKGWVKSNNNRKRGNSSDAPSTYSDEQSDILEVKFKRILDVVSSDFEVNGDEILRPRSRQPGRKYLIELCVRHCLQYSGMKELGTMLGVSGSALAHQHRSFQKRMDTDPHVKLKITSLTDKL